MDTARIAELLNPFTAEAALSPEVLGQFQRYLDLLLRWNARINLTAVREPEQIVTRHFGESLFAARVLLGGAAGKSKGLHQGLKPALETGLDDPAKAVPLQDHTGHLSLADVGSGAGFPGIPIKLFAPELELTLIESQNKKATFLREVIRTLNLERAEVFCGRAENWGKTADLVTLRAVEQFENALPVAADLVAPGGKLCLLIGTGQVPAAREFLRTNWTWCDPVAVPKSTERVVLLGSRP
jgi:16S rRNA (guanine527-N7)-methyltransferase